MLARLPGALTRGGLVGLACGVAAVVSAWGLWWVLRLVHDGQPGVMMQLDSQRAVSVGQLLFLWGSGVACGAAAGFWAGEWLRREACH